MNYRYASIRFILILAFTGLIWAQEGEGDKERPFIISGYASTEYERSAIEGGDGDFDAHFLEIIMTGRIGEHWSFRSAVEYEHGGEELNLEEVYAQYTASDAFKAQLGLFIAPFGLYNQNHRPHFNRFVDRPLAMDQVLPSTWEEIGFNLTGALAMGAMDLDYSVFYGNGLGEGDTIRNGRETHNENGEAGFGGRLSFQFDLVDVGFSFADTTYDETATLDLTLTGAHLSAKLGPVAFIGEYVEADLDIPTAFGESDINGFYAQLAWGITQNFFVSYRLDNMVYLDPYHGSGFEAGIGGSGINRDEAAHNLCIAMYPTPKVVLKIQFQQVVQDIEGVEEDDLWLAQASYRF